MYKKHHPPFLDDEVWRLEKIGKEGAFHKRLNKESICTVKDFLTLLNLDASRLRKVLFLSSVVLDVLHIVAYGSCSSAKMCIANPALCPNHADIRRWHVNKDVGSHCGTCKNMCSN